MKVGILTLHIRENYGGILQAYALQTTLEGLGHQVSIITIDRYKAPSLLSDPVWRRFITYPIRFIKKNILGNTDLIIPFERHRNETILNLTKYTERFVAQYLHLGDYPAFSAIPKDRYDAIVVGSDQVWRKIYFEDVAPIENAYLSFAKDWNIKRISYAASFGLDNIDEYTIEEKKQCKNLIQHFDAITVREKAGVDICQNEFSISSQVVVDPTMLLSKEKYISLIADSSSKYITGDLFYYVLDEDKTLFNQIQKYAEKHGLVPFRVNAKPMASNSTLEERIQRPVSEWLNAFKEAKLIITDSFHACVFSIIFNKSFFVVKNKKRGVARIESLLQNFGLTDRIISADSLEQITVAPIEWNRINKTRSHLIKESVRFLLSYL